MALSVSDLKIAWEIVKELWGWMKKDKEIDEAEVFAEIGAAIQQPQNIAIRILFREPCPKVNSAFKHAIQPADIPDHTIVISTGAELKHAVRDDFFLQGQYGTNSDGEEVLTSELIMLHTPPWKHDVAGLFVLGRMRRYDCSKEFRRFDELVFSDFSYTQSFLVRRETDKHTGLTTLHYFICSPSFATARLMDIKKHLPYCIARASVGTNKADVRFHPNMQAVLGAVA